MNKEVKMEEPKQEVPQKKEKSIKDSKTTLTIIIGVLIFIVLILIGILSAPYVKSFVEDNYPGIAFWSEEEEEEMEEDAAGEQETELEEEIVEQMEEDDGMETIEGDVVSVEVPEGWTMV